MDEQIRPAQAKKRRLIHTDPGDVAESKDEVLEDTDISVSTDDADNDVNASNNGDQSKRYGAQKGKRRSRRTSSTLLPIYNTQVHPQDRRLAEAGVPESKTASARSSKHWDILTSDDNEGPERYPPATRRRDRGTEILTPSKSSITKSDTATTISGNAGTKSDKKATRATTSSKLPATPEDWIQEIERKAYNYAQAWLALEVTEAPMEARLQNFVNAREESIESEDDEPCTHPIYESTFPKSDSKAAKRLLHGEEAAADNLPGPSSFETVTTQPLDGPSYDMTYGVTDDVFDEETDEEIENGLQADDTQSLSTPSTSGSVLKTPKAASQQAQRQPNFGTPESTPQHDRRKHLFADPESPPRHIQREPIYEIPESPPQ